MGSVVTRSVIVPHLFAAGALHIVQIRRCELAHLVASQGRRLARFRCVLRERQFVAAECAGSRRLRDHDDEWQDATVFGVVLAEARGVEMRKVTESQCGGNSPSDISTITLGTFTKLRKATGSFAISVRPHEPAPKPMDGLL